MKSRALMLLAVLLSAAVALVACKPKKQADGKKQSGPGMAPVMAPVMTPGMKAGPVKGPSAKGAEVQMKAKTFLDKYQKELATLEKTQTLAYWKAANSGKKADYAAAAKAELALKTLHSDPKRYQTIRALLKQRTLLTPLQARSLKVAELSFKGNQLPKEMLGKLVKSSTEIEQTFSTFRAKVGGKAYTNNSLLERLGKEKDSKKRKAYWEGLKQSGEAVGPKLIALAKLRNQAAKKLGYANFWEMQIRLQEHDPKRILKIFAELETLTNAPFKKMKAKLDAEVATKLKVKASALMPWHYDNPFFQAPPPSAKVDLNSFFKGKKKEWVVTIGKKFYADIGLPIDAIVKRSDLFERKGKDQHAFCISIDRSGDVRTLQNIKPTADWNETNLHEMGHAVYYEYIDPKLPFNLREAAHIFTTEAVAMLMGALGKDPLWLKTYAGAAPKRIDAVKADIREQRVREQLIFTRWTLVMLNFEKALYENPDQDLNKLWWDHVEKYQFLKRPPKRSKADWASKPHFTIAPVYYHNYMLGELFAAQLRDKLKRQFKVADASALFSGPAKAKKQVGKFFIDKVFKPGQRMTWPSFVRFSTGKPLSAQHFAAEVKQP